MESDAPNWDLDSLCPGGPGGDTFATRRAGLQERLAALQQQISSLPPIAEDPEAWIVALLELDPLEDAVSELSSFAGCAAAADSRAREARSAEASADELRRELDSILVAVEAALAEASPEAFEALLDTPSLQPAGPWLRHLRSGAALRLERSLQALKVSMDREAITGWGRLYDLLSGDLMGSLVADGEVRRVGIAELDALRAHPSPELRRAAYEGSSRAWHGIRDICAHTLTQLTGARQQLQDRLGIDEITESLYSNRLQPETLDALWAGADALRPSLVRYLERKATLLGKERLDWFDRSAPLRGAGDASRLSWEHATATVTDAFRSFHPELASFATDAIARRWIDAAPAEGRRPGGFCTDLPQSRQSRIFMTFTGTMDNALVLAHELGHAWHNDVLATQPACRRKITNALAETASTLAEATVRDQVLSQATDPASRAFMLDQELQAAVAFLMDIPARFAFERQLFVLRRRGVFDADELSVAMVETQRRAYGDALGSWDPTFWCSKLHFYIPEFGFYNWPYTFGYLFSAAVYARARAEGPAFFDTLRDLLRRTGYQSSETLAGETLGVDLTDPAFWCEAARPIEARVEAFLEATG